MRLPDASLSFLLLSFVVVVVVVVHKAAIKLIIYLQLE